MRDSSLLTAGQIISGTAAAHGALGDWLTPDFRALIVSTIVAVVTAVARELWGRRKRVAIDPNTSALARELAMAFAAEVTRRPIRTPIPPSLDRSP